MADSSGLRRKILRWGQRVSVETAAGMETRLRESASPHRKTGELDAAIHVRAVGAGPRYRLHAEADVIHAATTNTGARPHVIRPRRVGGKLVFYWPKAGKVVALSSVNHPGNRGSHWWDKVMRGPVYRAEIRSARSRVSM